MTTEQAKTDKKKKYAPSMCRCVRDIRTEVLVEKVEKGAYMLCSDGFRHEITEKEIVESLNPINLINKNAMHSNTKYLIELVNQRNERDNISVVLIKAE